MDLKGGLNTYLLLNGESEGRYQDGDSPYGRKVKYLDDGGWLKEPEYARKSGLVKDQIYTVKEIYVGRSSSEVELLEVEGKFNTAMFEDFTIEKADMGDIIRVIKVYETDSFELGYQAVVMYRVSDLGASNDDLLTTEDGYVLLDDQYEIVEKRSHTHYKKYLDGLLEKTDDELFNHLEDQKAFKRFIEAVKKCI